MNQVAAVQQNTDLTALSRIEQVLIKGDLSGLDETQRLNYYNLICESLGLNKMTRPFEYMTFQGKMVLYARKDCTDQLRKRHNVSVYITARERIGDLFVVTARAKLPDGREDESTGAVAVSHLKGDMLANAMMKAETKSKRRVTLSICGLGMLDETEVETLPITKEFKQEPPKQVTSTTIAATTTTTQPPAQPTVVESAQSLVPPQGKPVGWKFSATDMQNLVGIAQKSGWAMPHVFNHVKKHYPESGGYQGLTREQFESLCEHIRKTPEAVK